ncbi:Type I iodothyronine deiodinase [Trichoplax sp. H2]|nr:Type I iodothyronine deiodinase [Trichoplax sp. H2]|eukprot:RDD47779.1 Type I iodothyronine deiodinase [Trichoplax sp. H2]
MAMHQKKETSLSWFMSAYLMMYGLFKLIKYFLTLRYYYPASTSHLQKRMRPIVRKNLQDQKVTLWSYLRSNFLNKQNLLFLGERFNFASINFLKVGQQAPKGRLFTLDQQQTDLQNIFNQSAKKIHEAHAADEWALPVTNENLGVCFLQPKKLEARINIAKQFINRFQFQLPFFIDCIENDTMKAYDAVPERLYVVDDGKIVYSGGPGPFAYSLDDMEQFLEKYVVEGQKSS